MTDWFLLWPAINQLELITHLCGQTDWVISLYRKPAAFFGPGEREGGDDGQPALGNSARKRRTIRLALLGLGKEVEDGTVVPYIEPTAGVPIGDVGDLPANPFSPRAKPRF